MALLEKLIDERQDWIGPKGESGLVSIVVPTRNRERLLKQTLESLLGQTYRPIQLVIVDDGSQDNTKAIVREMQESNPQRFDIQLLEQEHLGGSVARNAGAKQTSGEFIVFMDDDDVAANDFLEARVRALQHNKSANLAYGPWKRFTSEDSHYRLVDSYGTAPEPGSRWAALLAGWSLLLQGCVIRRELVSRVGAWNARLQKSQDLDYKARLMADETCVPTHTDRGLVFYRIHEKSISGQLDAAKYDSCMEVVDHMEATTLLRPDYEDCRSALAEFLWFHSFWFYGQGEISRGYRLLKRSKTHWPKIFRQHGLVPRLLDEIGLTMAIGPGYCILSRCRKAFGLSQNPAKTLIEKLPTVAPC